MAEAFLQLAAADRKAILEACAQQSGKGANVLEKDVWVCWTLEKLLAMPEVPPLAFKGGTSLSKAWNAIDRFSEDVDVTLDRRALNPDLDPFAAPSRSKAKRICAELDAQLAALIKGTIKPYFDRCLRAELGESAAETILGDALGQLVVPYPSCLQRRSDYLVESVLLELGGKNSIEPVNDHALAPYIADMVASLNYPQPTVPVLAAERTFWEKATLIHAECNRQNVRANVTRMSRHWYDLAQLARGATGPAALADRTLLEDVIRQKNVLYYAGFANYGSCLQGALRLVPDQPLATALREDFDRMEQDGMFWQSPGTFADVLEQLAGLQTRINELFG